jgi:mannobiose 2-epimerase
MMADKYPRDTMHYEDKFIQQWNYVQTYLIDHEHGDWYQAGIDKEPKQKTALKGQIWKGTYHNFRALINCTNRLNPDKVPPTVPTGVVFYKKGGSQILKWKPSTDNRGLLGYNIYRFGKRSAFTPLTRWDLPPGFPAHGKLLVRSVDLQGNESVGGKAVNY